MKIDTELFFSKFSFAKVDIFRVFSNFLFLKVYISSYPSYQQIISPYPGYHHAYFLLHLLTNLGNT